MNLKITDSQGLVQVSTLTDTVCDCKGQDVSCTDEADGNHLIFRGILGGVLLLLSESEFLSFFKKRLNTHGHHRVSGHGKHYSNGWDL